MSTVVLFCLITLTSSITNHEVDDQQICLSYIVYMGSHTHGVVEPSLADLHRVTDSHHELLSSSLGIRHINGFAAMLREQDAAELAKHPDVVSVFPNQRRLLHTTRSWQFLGLEGTNGVIPSNSLWKKARFGEDVIIANFDSGVWPEAKSFSDEGMGPIPPRWRGICQQGIQDGVRCNRKLIGARYFNNGLDALVGGKLNSTFKTARDHNGHGTHTLSTAGGNFVAGASVFGHGNGSAKGGSPNARLSAYKVCWTIKAGENDSCYDANILKAFDAAISDGVDIISVSIGADNSSRLFENSVSIGAFHAAAKGIIVVASAGNYGNILLANDFPWLITVAASTMDREFVRIKFIFSAIAIAKILFYPLIYGAAAKNDNATQDDAESCGPGTLNYDKVEGKILVCQDLNTETIDKSYRAMLAGAVGMILVNEEDTEFFAEIHFLPTSSISYHNGQTLLKYINSTVNPVGYITHVRTELNVKPAPVMAAFSSRGPSHLVPSILKPDITAPGISIIAAFSGDASPTTVGYDRRRFTFLSEIGTSMACPHISGIAGLLRTLFPDWSPAAIRSAIMTTATIRNNKHELIMDATNLPATPFAFGAGHVRPNRAMDPGLVYDLSTKDYLNFLCARGYKGNNLKPFTTEPYSCPKSVSLDDFNYPSISIPLLNGTATVTRRLKNVGPPGTYSSKVTAPEGVSVLLSPETLKFEKVGQEITFKLMVKNERGAKPGDLLYGWLTWSDGKRQVRSPIVVLRRV
ncbi:hypothetical protein ACFE04_006695 [Oxalis oulophora]